jgi:Zn-dependent protease
MAKLHFSQQEKHDLFVAWVLISIAFGVASYVNNDGSLAPSSLNGSLIGQAVLLSGLTVGIGFLVHELAHKFVAQHYGKYAEFQAHMQFLVIAILMSFTGVVFAAPGAVVISGYSTRREMGHIAVAGPISNIVLALLVLPLFLLVREGFWGMVVSTFYSVNVWLALFNMIPIWMLDGKKVLNWSKKWYFITLAIIIALFVLGLAWQ